MNPLLEKLVFDLLKNKPKNNLVIFNNKYLNECRLNILWIGWILKEVKYLLYNHSFFLVDNYNELLIDKAERVPNVWLLPNKIISMLK